MLTQIFSPLPTFHASPSSTSLKESIVSFQMTNALEEPFLVYISNHPWGLNQCISFLPPFSINYPLSEASTLIWMLERMQKVKGPLYPILPIPLDDQFYPMLPKVALHPPLAQPR